ncbi:MAG: nitroreductase family protein [Candidatus Sabulitectum sp.]|nr:nitroreductase family protein [Candidatus Sabulitectum sp.]
MDSIETDLSGRVVSFLSTCIGCAHCGSYCPSNCYDLPGIKHSDSVDTRKLQDLYENRRSVRSFSEKEIDESVISSLLEPVGFSPTGRNAQGITVDVILGYESVEKLLFRPLVKLVRVLDSFRLLSLFAGKARGAVKKIRNGEDIITWKAPCVLLFRAPRKNVTGSMDAVIAATMVSIKAEAMGLGCFWNGVVQMAAPVLPISKPNAVLCIGYPAFKKHQHVPAREWTRRDISQIV